MNCSRVYVDDLTLEQKKDNIKILKNCPPKYRKLLKALEDYKYTIVSKDADKSYSKMRRDVCSNNVGYTLHIGKTEQPLLPSLCMKKNKGKIYKCCEELWGDIFDFDSGVLIQVNKNFKCPPHKDSKNNGESLLMGLGDYIGGETYIEGRGDYNIRYNPVFFNGAELEHEVHSFYGLRHSVVIAQLKRPRRTIGDIYKETLEKVYDIVCMEEKLGTNEDFNTYLDYKAKNRFFTAIKDFDEVDIQKIKDYIFEVIFQHLGNKKNKTIDEELKKMKKLDYC